MASDMSKMLKRAAESCANEMAKEADNKIQIALKRTMERVENKIDEIVEEYMVNAYYNGYSPVEYIRTYQLGKAVKSYTEPYVGGSMAGFSLGVIFDEDQMNHKNYRIKVKYYNNRKNKWVEKEYPLKGRRKSYKHSVDELEILEAFQDGIHPNAVPAGMTSTPNGMPLWKDIGDDEKDGVVPAIIEAWADDDGIKDIFLDELNKLYK